MSHWLPGDMVRFCAVEYESCPRCGARKGDKCRYRRRTIKSIHQERIEAAHQRWRWHEVTTNLVRAHMALRDWNDALAGGVPITDQDREAVRQMARATQGFRAEVAAYEAMVKRAQAG